MAQKFKLNTIKDFSSLTTEQFARMLPDLIGWHQFVRYAQENGAEAVGFTWVDDGLAGEMHTVSIHETSTGKTHTIKGPAAPQQGADKL